MRAAEYGSSTCGKDMMFIDAIDLLAARFNAGELTAAEYVRLVEEECNARFPPAAPHS